MDDGSGHQVRRVGGFCTWKERSSRCPLHRRKVQPGVLHMEGGFYQVSITWKEGSTRCPLHRRKVPPGVLNMKLRFH